MTTAEQLQGMTNRSQYERIANSYLRSTVPSVGHLVESGINEKGESVKSPLDAFCQVDGNQFVLVEHTTSDLLERKWLYDRSQQIKPGTTPDGDLIKAIREAKLIKKDIPAATFQIYLTTNQRVPPELIVAATKLASAEDITLKVVEQSTLSHFLDTSGEGQYLRKLYFGVTADLLSVELIREVQDKCMEAYRIESYLPPDPVTEITDIFLLLNRVKNQPLLLSLIQAESGMGKTTLCYQMMKRAIENSEIAIRVTPELILGATNITDLVIKTLLAFDQNLHIDAAAEELIRNQEILIVADDLNNTPNSQQSLSKLISWSFSMKDTKDGKVRIVCPVWNRVRNQLITDERKKEGAYEVYLEPPNAKTCELMITEALDKTGITVSELDKADMADRCGRDPLLLGLAIHQIHKNNSYNPSQAKDIIRSFVSEKLAVIGETLDLPVAKQWLLIAQLAQVMLAKKALSPFYNDVEKWMGEQSEAMRFCNALAVDKQLFYFDDSGKMHFRHDRIRDFILSIGMGEMLLATNDNIEILSEPFYSDYFGLAIAQNCTTLGENRLSQLIKVNPLGFYCAIKYVGSTENLNKRTLLLQIIHRWTQTEDFSSLQGAVLYAITLELSSINIPDIKALTAPLETKASFSHQHLNIAGFRNGSVMGAIRFLLSYPDFEPYFGNARRDALIDHLKGYHLEKVSSELLEYLRPGKLNQQGKKGALLLCGHLRQETFMHAIKGAWNPEDQGNEDMIGYYLWATISCVGISTTSILQEFLQRFESLPDEGTEDSGYPKGTKNTLIHTFEKTRWKLTNEQIRILISLGDTHRKLVFSILYHIDDPVALQWIVRRKAENLEKSEGHPLISSFITDPWNYQKDRKRLSVTSLTILEEIWKNPASSRSERIVAFRIFVKNAEPDEVIRVVHTIPKTDTDLYTTAWFHGALSGNMSAAGEFIKDLAKHPFNVRYLSRIWNDETKTFFRTFFKGAVENGKDPDAIYGALSLLRRIPLPEAEELLLENWEAAKSLDEAVQTALYLSTEKTRAAAGQAINGSPHPALLLNHVDRAYECLDSEMGAKVSLHKLQSLEPYLQYLSDMDLASFAHQAQRNGHAEWAKEKLGPYLSDETRKMYFPSQDLLLEELEETMSNHPMRDAYQWLSWVKHRHVAEADIIAIIRSFAATADDLQRFTAVANILAEIGNREDLSILDTCPIPNETKPSTIPVLNWVTYHVRRRTLV